MITKTIARNRFVKWKTAALAALAVASLATTPAFAGNNDNDENEFRFNLVRSPALSAFTGFVPNARGRVKIESVGPVEIMDVKVEGLPPNTDFDFFVIQVPHAPFGLAWYQGDIETNRYGVGHGRFIGRFNIETFIVAGGGAPAPLVFNDPPFPDAAQNLAANPVQPVQLYHLGLWFNDPNDAVKAGFPPPSPVTPFNGEHNAGPQVLNTQTPEFPDDFGPLRHVK
jgi:hypothetical protein